MIEFISLIILSYLLGALLCGLIIGKLHGIDVRKYGSGKIGATNVLRSVGLSAAIGTFISDSAKVIIPVPFGRFILGSSAGEVAAALAAIIGHNYPIYIKFQGGRGVTTSLGGLLAMSPPLPWFALIALVVFGIVVALSRYVSLGSILGALSVLVAMIPLTTMGRMPEVYLAYGVVGSGLIIFQHRDNIRRLASGRERKIGERGEKRE